MGPTIILDKSSLQALSKKELVLLNKLYLLNIPPILTIEILADLKKGKGSASLGEEKVIEIANKLIQKDSVLNIHYLSILISSLMGVNHLDGKCRPIVAGGKKVKDEKGKVGLHFVETVEQQAIKNWQVGNFSEAEKLLAQSWRIYSKNIRVDYFKRNFL